MAKQIGGSVGLKGKNVSADVTAVQELLNLSRGRLGGPPQAIAVDGVVGPETVSAISRFQKQNFGWSDGRVDPPGTTLAKLNAIADGNGNSPPSTSASPSKGAGGTTSTQSSGFSSAPVFGPNAETASTQAAWALITSVTGKVKMRFPGSGFLQAFAGFFLPTGSVLMTYDATGAPLTLPMTPDEFNSPYPYQAGSATLLMSDGSKRSIGPFTLFVVN